MVEPILEEEIGVESSPPVTNCILEVHSSDQHPKTRVESLDDDQSKGDDDHIITEGLNLGVHADHNTVKTTTSTAIAQTTSMTISLEELDRLEKINLIKAFDLMIKSSALFFEQLYDDSSETLKENLLVELRTKVLEADLL